MIIIKFEFNYIHNSMETIYTNGYNFILTRNKSI